MTKEDAIKFMRKYFSEEIVWDIVDALKQEPVSNNYICLTKAEIQSGFTRVQWAEGLIKQIPKHHEGRNSWLIIDAMGEDDDTC